MLVQGWANGHLRLKDRAVTLMLGFTGWREFGNKGAWVAQRSMPRVCGRDGVKGGGLAEGE